MAGTTWTRRSSAPSTSALGPGGEHEATGEILEDTSAAGGAATTVRMDRNGGASVTDGPFIEGKEMVGGYAVIDVPDLDAAIKLMSGWPAPDVMEIRPVVENPG